jgi:hypothetical protein
MARAGVADFEAYIDKAARCLPDQLLGARDSVSRDELERGYACRFFENMREVRGTQFHEFSKPFDRDFLGKMLSDVILNLSQLSNRQAAKMRWSLGSNFCVFFNKVRGEELCERRDSS